MLAVLPARLRTTAGHSLWTECLMGAAVSAVEDGNPWLAADLRDAAGQKRVEAELIRARESAYRARDESDRANVAKSRFLATASHDLRQPLQSLSLLNGILRRLVSGPDAVDAVRRQEQAIGAMSRLLNALLDISKLESGAVKPELSDFAVAALFRELRSDFASLATSKGLKLHVEDCADCVHSDPSLVQQILSNLVSNAIKYTREGWVRLRCMHEHGLVRVEVLDTGIGIAADQVGHIYDEFYQIDIPTNASRDGYGLGLSIVQRLVRLLELKLDVCSESGKGSAFSLLLPASTSRAESQRVRSMEMPEIPARQLQIDRPHVLLVDDDRAVRDATRMLLAVEGYRVT